MVSSPLKRIGDVVRKAREKQESVVAALPTRHRRNVGVELTSDDPVDIGWKLRLLGQHGPKAVDEVVDVEEGRLEQNSDCSIRINIDDDGRVFVRVKTHAWDEASTVEVVVYQPKTPGVIDEE